MDTTLETQVIESPCATGNCPLPVDSTLPTETESNLVQKDNLLHKGDLILFNLRGKVRSGKVITKGKVHLGIDILDMKSNTKIPATTEFVPVTVFVEKEVLDSLKSEVDRV